MFASLRAFVACVLPLCAAATVLAQAPTITGFSPGTIGIGMPVVITGSNFTAPVTVRFAGVTATGAVINTPSQITVPAPGTLNPGTITVQTSAGTATSPTSYAVTLVPVVTGFSPATGPEKRIVTLNGYNFNGTGIPSRTVRVNGVAASNLSVSNTSVTFAIPTGASTGPISIETPHGLAASATDFIVAAGAPPANDAFAAATSIGGPSGSFTGNTANATSEPGEPAHAGGGGATVWFRWTAPSSGLFIFNPYDGQQFGIVQSIYTGASLGGLSLVASGLTPPNVFARFSSAAVLNAVAGTSYYIALDGFNGVMANYRLQWAPFGLPTISSFTGSGFAGQQVSITGTNFSPGSIVTIGGTVVNPARINWNTQTSIIVNQLPYASVTGPIVVTTPAGTATSAGNFNVLPPPAPIITGISATSGSIGSSVTITGTNLWVGNDAPQPVVRFNGVAATSVNASSATSISALVPVGASTGFITVEFPHGSGTSPVTYTVLTPPPLITSFTPSSGPVGTAVTITGVNFGAVDQVRFNGTLAAFTVDSDSQVTAIVPAGATTGEITVGSPFGVGFSGLSFTVTTPFPVITDFSPSAIASGLTVTINGSSFTGATSVQFNGVSATSFTVVSPGQISATAPATLNPGAITVTTPLGTATSPINYTVSLAPVITAITPPSGPVNRIVTVAGFNFFTPVTVRVNGTPIGSFSRSNTTLTFAIPAGATTGPITVQTSNGLAVSPMNIVIGPGPAPANDHFANAQVIAGTTGVLSGNTANATKEPGEPDHASNPGGASVWFTWTAPSSGLFLFNPSNSSSSQFGIIQTIYTGDTLATLVPVASGLPPVSVFARYGSAAVLDAVAGTTYRIALDGYNGVMADYRLSWSPLNPPSVTSFTPTSGTAGQTVSVNVSGSNITPGATVVLGGATVDPSRLTFQNPNLVTITQIPLTAVTGLISITTPAGSATSPTAFSVTPPPSPTITGFTPGSAVVGGNVTISGTNFTGAMAVLFNGTSSSFSVPAATSIVATVPAGASTGSITVVTPGGSAVSAASFVVIAPPVINDDPDPQAVFVGANVSFSVGVTSSVPVAYQWLKNGGAIFGNPSATTPTLELAGVGFGDAALYSCFVSSSAGFTTSASAALIVKPMPVEIVLSNLTATFDGSPKPVTATATPPVPLHITYAGSTTPPSAAGSYSVVATVLDPMYAGTATGTLVINPAPVTLALSGLAQPYDGSPRSVTVTTAPAGVAFTLTYAGSATAPTLPGAYAVVAASADSNYTGSATGTLLVRTTALVRQMPVLNGGLDGSIQVTLPNNVVLNPTAWVSSDLLVPGTPNVLVGGSAIYGGTLDSTGDAAPSAHTITLNGAAVLRHVVRRVDAIPLPVVAPPPLPAGTRTVSLVAPGASPGDFATLRNLTLGGNAGSVAVPPGTYGDFTANGAGVFVFGVAGASTPAVYHLQRLTLNAISRLQLAGPVILTVAGNVVAQGKAGDSGHPEWLSLDVASGNVTVNGTGAIYGRVSAPNGTVTINAGTIEGGVVANQLVIGSNGVLKE